jgi:hypothetical protein
MVMLAKVIVRDAVHKSLLSLQRIVDKQSVDPDVEDSLPADERRNRLSIVSKLPVSARKYSRKLTFAAQ